MLIIGLVGSTDERRERVASQAALASRVRLSTYAMYTPSTGPQRSQLLAQVLPDFEAAAAEEAQARGLVVAHVRTLQEAQLLRARGGHIWHVQGRVSPEIPIMRTDLLVTDIPHGERHYLDACEAISETLRRHAPAAA